MFALGELRIGELRKLPQAMTGIGKIKDNL